MEPQSKVDCPIETPVFYPAETLPYEVTDILSGIRTSRRPARCGEPRNQSDCPAGTKFREGMPEKTGGAYMRAIPAICVKSAFSDLFPKCGPETGTEPDGKGGCRPIGRPNNIGEAYGEPQTQADCPEGTKFKPRGCKPPQKCTNNRNTCEGTPLSPVTTKNMAVGSNWLLPALLVGAGIFILTRKSE
jgi:hypothetical protein